MFTHRSHTPEVCACSNHSPVTTPSELKYHSSKFTHRSHTYDMCACGNHSPVTIPC
jgi:hypothetical protein